jgi:Asp/Glu/hydantoin racemase
MKSTGVCRSTAQNALRAARRLGLITVQERRRRGMASLTNVVRIVSREWTAWNERGEGSKN